MLFKCVDDVYFRSSLTQYFLCTTSYVTISEYNSVSRRRSWGLTADDRSFLQTTGWKLALHADRSLTSRIRLSIRHVATSRERKKCDARKLYIPITSINMARISISTRLNAILLMRTFTWCKLTRAVYIKKKTTTKN